MKMLSVIVCLAGVGVILVAGEMLRRRKLLKGENQRKFVHILAGSFIAFWPWLVSMQTIQLLGLAMLLVVAYNHYKYKKLYFMGGSHKKEYGDLFLALAVTVCAMLTVSKVFFALAILQVALADGLAAIAGVEYGKRWRYKVFGRQKTVIGSMTFWFVSLCILGIGLLIANTAVSFSSYYYLLLLLPPVLTILENTAVLGADNVLLPVVAILVLRAAA